MPAVSPPSPREDQRRAESHEELSRFLTITSPGKGSPFAGLVVETQREDSRGWRSIRPDWPCDGVMGLVEGLLAQRGYM